MGKWRNYIQFYCNSKNKHELLYNFEIVLQELSYLNQIKNSELNNHGTLIDSYTGCP